MPRSETASTKPDAVFAPETTTGGVGWRERCRVLEQFGDEVREVGDRSARDCELVVDAHELDAREVGDLRRGRTHDVEQPDRLLPLARLLGTRQHEETLRIPTHACRHVVELEERVERRGIVFVALELVEQLELTLEQALVAAREVHEQIAHALAQQQGLVARDLHRHGFDVVERARELADFVVRVDLDRREGRTASTSPPARIESTSCGSCFCDISRALSVSFRSGRMTARATIQISTIVRSIAKTVAPP